jgi:hypothetical protein
MVLIMMEQSRRLKMELELLLIVWLGVSMVTPSMSPRPRWHLMKIFGV